MATRIALVEHKQPRILTLDFSQADVSKLASLGFNVRKGSTGLHDGERFTLPWSIHDVEIIFANIASNSFSKVAKRTAHENSLVEGAYFQELFNEVWAKRGWIVFFIAEGCDPTELHQVGISNIGVMYHNDLYLSTIEYIGRRVEWKKSPNASPEPRLSFPKFISESVMLDERVAESSVLKKYLKFAKLSVLAANRNIHFLSNPNANFQPLIEAESTHEMYLAIKLLNNQHRETAILPSGDQNDLHDEGALLLLPDFGKNNIDVAIELLEGAIADAKPSLFDSPSHPWLENYLPYIVDQIRENKMQVISDAQKKAEQLEEKEKQELEKYNWMLGLLTARDKEFEEHVAEALRFLGFKAQQMDDTITPGERKKEDLHIQDSEANYFAIGEAKSTNRGASESFITDTQNHQGRYSREHNVSIPNAILVVNHSIKHDPLMRSSRFYRDQDIADRCREQAITAIDSFALFLMCQSVLRGSAERAEVRRFITNDHKVISSDTALERYSDTAHHN